MKLWLVLFTTMSSSIPVIARSPRSMRPSLHAPTYYVVVSAHLQDEKTIVVRGASNLPAGAKIAIEAGDHGNSMSESACAGIGDDGFFLHELHPVKGGTFKWSSHLAVDAIFRVTECQQPEKVLHIVGKHGQYLGNDNYDNKIDIHTQMTPGMNNNPQLFQESGWYYGLSTWAPVSQF